MRFRISYKKSNAVERPPTSNLEIEMLKPEGQPPVHVPRNELRAFLVGEGLTPKRIDEVLADLEEKGIVEIA